MTTFNNMGLTWPDVGSATYPAETDASAQKLDEHDHSLGKGVQIGAGGLAANAVTTVKILDSNVTTPKIADEAVTLAKLEPDVQARLGNIQIVAQATSESLSGSTTSDTPQEVLTTSGSISDPIELTGLEIGDSIEFELFPAASSFASGVQVEGTNVAVAAGAVVVKDQDDNVFIMGSLATLSVSSSSSTDPLMKVPAGSFRLALNVDTAGDYTFRLFIGREPLTPTATISATQVLLRARVWRVVA